METALNQEMLIGSAPTGIRKLWVAIVLGSLSALAPLSIDMYLPALPALARGLQVSTSLAQLSLTACLLGLALGQLVAGPVSDSRGRRLPLLIGMLAYTLSSLFLAFTSSIWLLVLLRLIQGLSGSVGIVISRAVVRDYFSGSEITKFLAVLMLINGAAPILAPIIGGQLLRFMPWQGVFVVLAILGLLMFLGVLFGLPESLPIKRRSRGGLKETLHTMRHLAGDRFFMGCVWSQGLILAAMFGYISGSPFVLQNIFSVSPQIFSVIFAVNGLGIILSGQLGAHLSARFGEAKVLLAGLLLAGAGGLVLLGVILAGAGLIAVLLPLFIVVSSVGVVSATATSLALQKHGKSAGSASALIGVSGMLAGSAVTPLVGLGGSRAALPMAIVIAVCDIAAVLCYPILLRRKKI